MDVATVRARMFFSTIKGFARDERAATAAEFALVVPVFFGLVFATINGSIMMSAVIQMHYAAERTARCMSVDVGAACDNPDTYAKGVYNGPSLAGLVFTPTSNLACGNRVVGSGAYELVSGLAITTVNISATSCYPVI